jgi:hypothetical protein
MTDAELASKLHRDLQGLALEAGWATAATLDQPQGHYSDLIADAKADVGVTIWAAASAAQIKRVRQLALLACLDRLELHFATLTDLKVGQREERLSQIGAAVARARAGGSRGAGTAAAVGFTLRRGPAVDYSAGEGDASDA